MFPKTQEKDIPNVLSVGHKSPVDFLFLYIKKVNLFYWVHFDPMEIGSQTVGSCHVGVGNRSRSATSPLFSPIGLRFSNGSTQPFIRPRSPPTDVHAYHRSDSIPEAVLQGFV